MFKKAKYFLAATALLGLAISGCSNSKTDGSVVTPNPNPFQPKGTVAGVLTDSVTNEPIANATIYIMDKSAVTNAGGSFSIANVSANLATGNEPTNAVAATDPYQVVIDMKAVNDAIAVYNADAANTTKKAYYPSFAYTTATVKYDSLGDAAGAIAPVGSTAGTTSTNHDTPVDGFVASIAPKVGKLDANVKIQVVNSSTFANISGATVELMTGAAGTLATSPTGNIIVPTATGHVVATGTTDTSGLVTFSGVEAGRTFLARATSSDGTLSGITGDARNGGGVNSGPLTIITEADKVTVSYLLNQTKNALMVASVDTQAPIILAATPENNSDLTPATTGTQDVVFTFSKPIKANTYALATDVSKSGGPNAAAGSGLYRDIAVNFVGSKAGNIAHSLAWSTDMKTLTVSIPAPLAPSSKYTVSLAGCSDTTSELVDSLNTQVTAANIIAPGKGVINFTTSGGSTAAAPTVVVVGSTLIDFNSTVNLDWLPASGAKKYNVYRSLIENWGTTTTATPYRLINTVAAAPVIVSSSDYADNFTNDVNGDKGIINDTTNGALSATTNFVEAGHVKLTYSYIVKSVNSDGTEGAGSTAVTAADVTGSNIVNAGATFITDIIDGNSTVTVFFTEPLDETSAETATNYTLSGISGTAPTVSSAVYNGWDALNGRSSVTLTLSASLTAANITRTYISPGTDGILQSATLAGDGQLMPVGTKLGQLCVTPNGTGDTTGAVLSTPVNAADFSFLSADSVYAANSIYAGADGVCNSVAVAGDTAVAGATAGTVGITAATYAVGVINNLAADFTLASTVLAGSDDLIVRQILVTVGTGVTDVAGNAIKTTTVNATTAGNRINSDGTFTLP